MLVIFSISCKSTMIAQEKEQPIPKKQKITKPKYSDLVNEKTIAPNTIRLQAMILKRVEPATICNIKYSSSLEVKVIQTLESGSGITNMIIKNHTYIFALSNFIKQSSIPKIGSDKIINLTLRQGICQKANESLYEIIDFQ